MSDVIAGAVSGLFMAAVFVAIAPVMLFFIAKDPSPRLRALLRRTSLLNFVMALVVLAYPVWAISGVALGLLFRVTAPEAAGGGMGSLNPLYTLAVVGVAIAVALPSALLLKRVVAGVAALALTFILVFGLLLPLLASR